MTSPALRPYPWCDRADRVRDKVLLVDPRWPETGGADRNRGTVRVDHLRPEQVGAAPLEQFVEGYYCDRCGRGFVADDQVKPRRRSRLRPEPP